MTVRSGTVTRSNLPNITRRLGRPPQTLGDVLDMAPPDMARIIVHGPAYPALGLPEHPDPRNLSDHPFLVAHGWRLSSTRPTHWIVARRGGHRIDVWFPGYDDVAGLADVAPGPLLDGLALFEELIGGTPYRWSPGATAINLIRTLHRSGIPLDASGVLPHPATGATVEADFRWAREPDLEERTMRWVHAYDLNAMYLAACSSLELGFGEPEHLAPKRTGGLGFDAKVPGYWRVTYRRPDRRLPDPFDPLVGGAGGSFCGWLTTPSVELAAELGALDTIEEAFLYPRHHRYLDSFYQRLREARGALLDSPPSPSVDVALRLVKRTYTVGLGYLAARIREEGDPLYRPDWRHAVIAKARANLYRRLVRLPVTPFAVLVDCVYFASNDPDPLAAIPGLPLAHTLGAFKHAGTAPMPETLAAIEAGDGPDAPFRGLRQVLR